MRNEKSQCYQALRRGGAPAANSLILNETIRAFDVIFFLPNRLRIAYTYLTEDEATPDHRR